MIVAELFSAQRWVTRWWKGAAAGLQEKLINEADATSAGLSGLVIAIASALASTQQHDAVAKTVLANSPPSWSSNDFIAHIVR